MDKTSEGLHKTIAPLLVGAVPGGPVSPIMYGRPPMAQPSEAIAARLRSVAVESQFEAREWRLGSGTASAFDHGLLLQSGEAWLHARDERLHVLGPSFVWSPANATDRLVIEAGGSGYILQIRRDLMEQTFRQIPEASELINLLAAEQPLALAIEARSAMQLSRTISLIASELREPGPGAETVISSALVISFVHCGVTSVPAPSRAAKAGVRRRC